MRFLQKTKVTNVGYNQLGRFVGEPHPQKIKHHLEQLEKKKFIKRNKKTGFIKIVNPIKIEDSRLINLRILGSASCGPAELLAEENLEGYLKISPRILKRKDSTGLFAIKASGDSLNAAKDIEGGPIENGDYVVIDSKNRKPKNGDYVLSVIDDAVNLKRFYLDKEGKQVILVSESTSDIPPIYIHFKDLHKYMINGVIVRIIKKPKPA
jgi:SOS-response transcriptional repressor LexA